MITDENILEVKGLKEYFNINTGAFQTKPLKAVDDVSFAIRKGGATPRAAEQFTNSLLAK